MRGQTDFLTDTWTLQYQLVSLILPIGVTLVVCFVGFAICKLVCNEQEKIYNEKIALPANYEFLSLDERMQIVIAHRAIAGRGSPAERLFLKTLPVIVLFSLLICFLLPS
ncbi:MAG: hypothetical protein CK426_09270 [Legionella sp.]|nr:MAG: hypothetical protein CK426_09270 [Legionella sp.]